MLYLDPMVLGMRSLSETWLNASGHLLSFHSYHSLRRGRKYNFYAFSTPFISITPQVFLSKRRLLLWQINSYLPLSRNILYTLPCSSNPCPTLLSLLPTFTRARAPPPKNRLHSPRQRRPPPLARHRPDAAPPSRSAFTLAFGL